MIIYQNKDITTVEQGIIAHGVNCQGVMGSGVAKALRKKWPIIYSGSYTELTKDPRIRKDLLGVCQIVRVNQDATLHVANCFTQIFYGIGGKFACPNAIEISLSQVYGVAKIYQQDVYIPKIGAGLGGLDWEKDVLPIIEHLDEEHPMVDTFVCCIDT